MLAAMPDVTQILSRIEAGDPSATDELLPLVYDELRRLAAQRLAQEKPGQTLQATALVHEAYILTPPTRRKMAFVELPFTNPSTNAFRGAKSARRCVRIGPTALSLVLPIPRRAIAKWGAHSRNRQRRLTAN
jgi:hypothetical protein